MAIAKRMGTFFRINRWLLAGIVVIGVAAYVSARYVQIAIQQANAKTHVPTVQVLVASQPIAAYEPITSSMVTVKTYPVSAVPAGSYSSIQPLNGAWTTEAISPGVPLVSSEVFFPKTANVLAARINPQDMAVDVPLSSTNAVDGLIMPGDNIALFITITEKNGQKVIEDFMNHVKVLAVNGSMTPPSAPTVGQSPNLIVAMTPSRIESLLFAEQNSSGFTAALESPHTKAQRPTPYGLNNLDTPVP
ncbi:Flp pilus assembly protein CpaB [Sulfobacillus thermosulfidooxidans]|uniref:Flp pilus assembly protein CpaB n=1 Tax=Sulfobacillus thermosulfidooxidans TaxID=28034 RepID=UPI0006B40D7B|nr:Flp pilus assembly protein CpaB [Sulfobacillus thermosulfidooxidans]